MSKCAGGNRRKDTFYKALKSTGRIEAIFTLSLPTPPLNRIPHVRAAVAIDLEKQANLAQWQTLDQEASGAYWVATTRIAGRPCGKEAAGAQMGGGTANEALEAHEGTSGDDQGPVYALQTSVPSLAVDLGFEATWLIVTRDNPQLSGDPGYAQRRNGDRTSAL
ncbi:hypothetical protein EYR38_001976 [Pleurotus pulmonarius]|nr:hypothetical protein EYR38_001976 [Pleurotus pulmonarius]